MRKSLLALFAVAMMLIVVVPGVVAEDDFGADTTYKISGQIVHGGGVPAESPSEITITLYKMVENVPEKIGTPYVGKLDASGQKGKFTVQANDVDENNLYISFSEVGYTVSGKTHCMEYKWQDFYKIDLEKATKGEGNEYFLTADQEYIHMGSAMGSIKGKIISSSGGNPPLNGIKVTITSVEGNVVRTTLTRNNGSFTFDDVGVGSYNLKAEGKGFITYEYEDPIHVYSGEITQIQKDIEMTPDNEIDTAHWMTIGGIIAAVLLILATLIHIVRIKGKSSNK